MISVIVPAGNDPPEALGFFERFATRTDAELLVEHDAVGSRGACLAKAAARARGEIFFFVHADSHPPENALELIRRTIEGGAAGGAFSLGYERDDAPMRWIAWWANHRSRLL